MDVHPSGAEGERPIDAGLEAAAINGMFRGFLSSSRVIGAMIDYFGWAEAAAGGKGPFVISRPSASYPHYAQG